LSVLECGRSFRPIVVFIHAEWMSTADATEVGQFCWRF
jgi:hypothetical protein